MHPLSAVPYAPLVAPLGQAEVLPQPTPEQVALAKQMGKWGMIGVASVSIFSAGITAAAFATYKKRESVLLPALISGVGSLAMGSVLLYVLVKGTTNQVDPRVIYAAAGAQLAA